MEIGQLRYVVCIAEEGSINKASKRLNIGQSSISKSIKELEEEIGCLIFHRTSSGIIPTKNGAEFLVYAKMILEQVDSLSSLYHGSSIKQPFGIKSLSVYVSDLSSMDYIEDSFHRWCHLYGKEHSKVNLSIASREEILSLFSTSQTIDFAVVRIPSKNALYWEHKFHSLGLQTACLWDFELYALMHASHPLASIKTLSYSMLKPYQEVICGTYREAKEGQIAVPVRSMQFSSLKHIAGAYALSSPLSKYQLISENLRAKPLSLEPVSFPDFIPTLSYQDIAVWTAPLSKSAELFLEITKQTIVAIQAENP